MPIRLKLLKPVRKKTSIPLYVRRAYTEWLNAIKELERADAECNKVYLYWLEIDSKYDKLTPEWINATTEWNRVDAKWNGIYSVWYKAEQKYRHTYANWQSSLEWSDILELHKQECPKCPWNGRSIFK